MKPKIFLIGFNKCGTTTINRFFKRNGISTVHHHFGPSRQDPATNLALIILQNIILGRDPLHGIDSWTAYSDLSYAASDLCVDACRFFKDIYRNYPTSYYILNTRPVDKWLRSRMNHGGGTLAQRWMRAYRCDKVRLEELWRAQFDAHSAEVSEFFRKKGAEFMVFDIERDKPDDLARFISPAFAVDPSKWRIANATRRPK
jgi:hypothetical protein